LINGCAKSISQDSTNTLGIAASFSNVQNNVAQPKLNVNNVAPILKTNTNTLSNIATSSTTHVSAYFNAADSSFTLANVSAQYIAYQANKLARQRDKQLKTQRQARVLASNSSSSNSSSSFAKQEIYKLPSSSSSSLSSSHMKGNNDNAADNNEEQFDDIDETTFATYSGGKIKNSKPHPDALIESSSMAAVQHPEITYCYHPNLENIVKEGLLSNPQMETVLLASQMHELRLANDERRGFFLGDGAGVGKGIFIHATMYNICL
jgi:hypothetical protein